MVATISTEVVLARLAPDDRLTVQTFRDDLRARFGARIRDLRLYGSKARGDDHEESDIDILVLLDVRDSETRREIVHMAHFIDPRLSPAIFEFDRYHEPASRVTGYYKEMRKESVRL